MTLEFARRIARVPPMTALPVKESVSEMQEAMGFSTALKHGSEPHTLGHATWAVVTQDRQTAVSADQRGTGPITVHARDRG
jgi:hypothetical protein